MTEKEQVKYISLTNGSVPTIVPVNQHAQYQDGGGGNSTLENRSALAEGCSLSGNDLSANSNTARWIFKTIVALQKLP